MINETANANHVTNTRETRVVAEPGKQDLFIIREFEAAREQVFRAFSDPDIMIRFFAPFDYSMHFNYADYRSGGRYSWSNKDHHGHVLCTFAGVIHEITAPERIIQTVEYMDLPERGNAVLEIISFVEPRPLQTVVTIHDVCPSVATRDAMIASGMDKGVMDIFRKLDNFFLTDRMK